MNLLIPLKQNRPIKGTLLKGIFIPKLLNNPQASRYFIALSHTLNFDKSIILPYVALATYEFLLSVFFYTSNNMITLFYK